MQIRMEIPMNRILLKKILQVETCTQTRELMKETFLIEESQKASLKSETILLMRQPLIDQRMMGNLVIIKGSQDLDHLGQILINNLQDQDHDL